MKAKLRSPKPSPYAACRLLPDRQRRLALSLVLTIARPS
jgi:hypothetical protein